MGVSVHEVVGTVQPQRGPEGNVQAPQHPEPGLPVVRLREWQQREAVLAERVRAD